MTIIRDHLDEYLRLRRTLGFKLTTEEFRLRGFCDWLAERNLEGFTAGQAVEWARSRSGNQSTSAARLSALRPFAKYLCGLGLPVEIPNHKVFPAGIRRGVPFLYSQNDYDALIAACPVVFARYPLTALTMPVVIGLLAVTGMRIGEAIRLDRSDFDPTGATLLIRGTKFGKDRLVPIAASTADVLSEFLASPVRRRYSRRPDVVFFTSMRGGRLRYNTVQERFNALTSHAGVVPAPSGAKPTLHGWRHSFTVNTMIAAHRDGDDPARVLTILSTWLGHTNPANTYWYLDGAIELLALSAQRLEAAHRSRAKEQAR